MWTCTGCSPFCEPRTVHFVKRNGILPAVYYPMFFIQCTCVAIRLYKGHHCALSCLHTVTISNSVHRLSPLFLSFLYEVTDEGDTEKRGDSFLCISFLSHFILCSSSLLSPPAPPYLFPVTILLSLFDLLFILSPLPVK